MDMTPEFILLAFTLILALVQIGAAGAARTAELGAKWNAGRATVKTRRRASWPVV